MSFFDLFELTRHEPPRYNPDEMKWALQKIIDLYEKGPRDPDVIDAIGDLAWYGIGAELRDIKPSTKALLEHVEREYWDE